MTARTVGIVSDNNGLYVALSLRGDGLEFTRVGDVTALAGHDVAVLDVPEGHDVAVLAADVPTGPALVVLTDDDTPVAGASVVPRPYAVGDLLDLLRTVTANDTGTPARMQKPEVLFTHGRPPRRAEPAAEEQIVVVDDDTGVPEDGVAEPEPEPVTPAPPLFDEPGTGPAFAPSSPPVEAPQAAPASVAVMDRDTAVTASRLADDILDVLDLESDDPIMHVRQLAQALSQALGKAEFLASIGVLADRLSASLAREHGADHLALWHRAQDSYIILGAAGLTSVARRDIVASDHPAIVEAQAQGGLLVEDLSRRTALTRSLPGARSPRYGCVLLQQPAIPVHLVTVSGQRVDYDQLVGISDVITEASEAWDAVLAVERLRGALGMA